jgi:triosephosphate isomerase
MGVLYGGSVNASNAGQFLNLPQIDGALVGGASLVPSEFNTIVNIAKGVN